MSFMDSITDKPPLLAPRIVCHGKGGVGKTTWGASAPDAILIPVEEGLGNLAVAHFPRPASFGDVMEMLQELALKDHTRKTLVIDTVDALEPLIWNHVCESRSDSKKQYASIEDFPYGRGFTFADEAWLRLFRGLDHLRSTGMTVIVLAHSESKFIEDPLTGPVERLQPKLHKRANSLLYEWADVVAFMDLNRVLVEKEGAKGRTTTVAQVLGERRLYLEDRGGFVAKNRYSLPVWLEVSKANPYASLRDAILTAFGAGENKK